VKKNEATEKAGAAEKTPKAAKSKAQAGPSRVTLTQLRAALDSKQALALRGLGLRRIRHTVSVVDTPSTRGLILKVRHLVEVKA
jgi:large subunit ribosomal protein L30